MGTLISQPRFSSRRWCVPPGLGEASAGLPGKDILHEDAGGAGLLLWQWFQDVFLWAHAAGEARWGLFDPRAVDLREAFHVFIAAHPDLRVPAACFAHLLGRPEAGQPPAIREACHEVARWAEGIGAIKTAMHFSVAGAEADPTSATAAEAAGGLAARSGRPDLADVWLGRALALGRREPDWAVYGIACVQIGHLREARGDLDQARRYFVQAWRMGRRHNLPRVRACAVVALLRIAVITGDIPTAATLQTGVRRHYPKSHPEHFRVWSDIAALWLTHGHSRRAFLLLQWLTKRRCKPRERIRILTLLARAGAELKEPGTTQAAWESAVALIQAEGENEDTARQLLDLARAVSDALEAWKVRQTLWRAREIARVHAQEDVEREAMAMLWPGREPEGREDSR